MTYTSYQFQIEYLLHLLKLCSSSIVISTRDVAAMSKYAQKIILEIPRQYVLLAHSEVTVNTFFKLLKVKIGILTIYFKGQHNIC